MMRAGFKAVLEAAGDIEVVAEASNGEEAVRAAGEHAPDVVLMDDQKSLTFSPSASTRCCGCWLAGSPMRR